MSYRDDTDALYSRATTLQREVDEMREQLAERDRRLAELQGSRELPQAADLIERLLERTESPEERWAPGKYPRFPEREPISFVTMPPELPTPPAFRRDAVLHRARELLSQLSDEQLVLIGAIVETVASSRWGDELANDLRALASRATRAR